MKSNISQIMSITSVPVPGRNNFSCSEYICVYSIVRMSHRICLNEKETNHSLEYYRTQCKYMHVCHEMDT